MVVAFWPQGVKTILLATGVVVAGGTAAYLRSRYCGERPDRFGQYNGLCDNKEQLEKVVGNENIVLRTALSNRLAKVQGFLFRAAFLRSVPTFFHLILENLLLCFLQSTLHSTSKYIAGTLSLRFRKILTKLIHAQYFQYQEAEPLTHSEMVDLEYLLDRYPSEKEINWGDELSLGEQQRLGMRVDFAVLGEAGVNMMKPSETERQSDAMAVQRAFASAKKDSSISNSKSQSYISKLIAASPPVNHDVPLPLVPQLQTAPRLLPLRVAAMFKILGRLHLTAKLALGWRIRLTQHLLKNYLRNNAYYKVFQMSSMNINADQRITQDLEKLTGDLSGVVTGMVKPTVDILWFTWRMKLLTGRRGVAILYAYMLLGLGFLRSVASDFGDLASREQQLEGTFRFMHQRSRTHAESIAFFGGGAREKAMVESRFEDLLDHSKLLHQKKWLFGELAHALRFLASAVSQSFLAFGDILELHRKYLELSGGINRIFELEELLDVAQKDNPVALIESPTNLTESQSNDLISFSKVGIISPSQKLLARKLTCDILPGKSLLVTGPNGSGKSSIFRVLRGLWPIVRGRLVKPHQQLDEDAGFGCGVFYIPQRPYTCLGTLRDQVIYPLSLEEAEQRTLPLYREGSGVTMAWPPSASNESGSANFPYCRKQKSLGLLCTNFVSLYNQDNVETIGLDDAATRLGVERRRIYDIVNGLESVGVLARKAKNRYSGKGFGGVPKTLQQLREEGLRENFNTFNGNN
ncbi:unnamed protein product [Camellia sinensis]